MAQAPYMPIFTDALIGDTTHLSAEEFGAYCLILFATWRNNGSALPDEPRRMARVCRVSERRWRERLRPILIGFFDASDGLLHQKRLEKEWNHVAKMREQNARAARARWLKQRDSDDTDASSPHMQPKPKPIPKEEETPQSPRKRGVRTGEENGFEEWWLAYPLKRDKGHAEKAFAKALKLAPLPELIAGVRRYIELKPPDREWCYPATWLNGKRWLDEAEAGINGAAALGPEKPASFYFPELYRKNGVTTDG